MDSEAPAADASADVEMKAMRDQLMGNIITSLLINIHILFIIYE